MKTRRVGSVTLGVFLTAVGALFALYTAIPGFDLRLVVSFWPLLLISLGAEVLIGNAKAHQRGEELKIDGGAVLLMALVCIAAFAAAFLYAGMRGYLHII